jgi:NTP pyrophosphatase (non-canonical NTP hydrolase)
MKTITLEPISNETVDKYCQTLATFIKKKLEKKGPYPFPDKLSCLGKLTEEFSEAVDAFHKKANEHILEELTDVATVAIFGMISIDQLYK